MTRTVGAGVALLCGCLLVAEVALTRVFSVTIWYHFAFLAISVALFGTGAASVGVHLAQGRLSPERTAVHLGAAGSLLAVTILASELVLLRVSAGWSAALLADYGKLFVLFGAASAPFLVGGFVVGLAMTRHAAHAHALYAWDLFGAAVGSLAAIPWMDRLDAPRVLAATSVLAAAAGALLSTSGPGPRWVLGQRLGAGLAVACAALVAFAPSVFEVRYAKGERLADKHPELVRWNSFSMVTVSPYEGGATQGFHGWGMSPRYVGPIAEQKALFIDLNAMTTLTRFDGDLDRVRHGLWDATAFVHQVRAKTSRVCVIGAGGGRDVLAALASGAEHVVAAELNPLIAETVMQGTHRDFVGDLYRHPKVTLRVGDGRAIVRGLREPLDVVHLSMVDTSAATAAGAYVLSENGLYTTEAFREYLSHLAPGGMLSVSSVSLPALAVGERLAALARDALGGSGEDPSKSVIVVSTPWLALKNATLHNVIVKKGAFTADELTRANEAVTRLGFHPTHLPGRPSAKVGTDAIVGILLDEKDESAVRAGIEAWPIDVSAPTDDRPFFFYQNRIADLVRMMAPSERTQAFPFGNGLFILAKVLLVSLVMVGACILIPLRRSGAAGRDPSERGADVAFVVLLGVGFMAIEIAMMQRVTLYLGRPSDGLAVVLFVLLAMGAFGSLRSGPGDLAARRRRLVTCLIALVAVLVLVFQSGLFGRALDATVGWTLTARIAIASAFLAPLGGLLGVALPTFIATVEARHPDRIPWLWGVNGACSVLGSVVATLVAMHGGISRVLWVAVVCYALAAFLARRGGSRDAITAGSR